MTEVELRVQPEGVVTDPGGGRSIVWATVFVALVAAFVCAAPLPLPHDLIGSHSYDDAVYLGAAIRLIHGALPYRDFAFVQPPGIAVVMAPVALLGQLIGDRDALGLARLVTIVVAAANAALAGRLLAPRGVFAVLVAGLCLALYPAAITADSTLLLEPYLVLLCLCGATLVFGTGEGASTRRLWAGGAAIGIAGTIKVWAVLPALALVICLAVTRRAGLKAVLGGMVVGFGAVAIVFVAAAPGAFVHDVIVSQLARATPAGQGTPVSTRLVIETGLPLLFARLGGWAIDIALAGMIVLGYGLGWRRVSALECFALISTVASLAAVLLVGTYYPHYSYVPGAFAALCLGVSADEIRAALARHFPARLAAPARRLRPVALALVAVLVGFVFVHDLTYSRTFLRSSALSDPGPGLAAQIPAGSCVVFDEPALAILSNRITSGRAGCPPLTDPFGVWLTLDPGDPPPNPGPYPAPLSADWQLWLTNSQYLVLAAPASDYLPWTPAFYHFFDRRFRLVYSAPGAYLYANDGF